MPAFVRTDLCDGCSENNTVACVYICPHDLMKLDTNGQEAGHTMKVFNQEPDQCWECYSCVKICPQNAIEVRAYADVVPMGGSVQPQRGDNSIIWSINFRNGSAKRFKFPIRTTPEGSINPYDGKPAAKLEEIAKAGFFNTDGAPKPGNPYELLKK